MYIQVGMSLLTFFELLELSAMMVGAILRSLIKRHRTSGGVNSNLNTPAAAMQPKHNCHVPVAGTSSYTVWEDTSTSMAECQDQMTSNHRVEDTEEQKPGE